MQLVLTAPVLLMGIIGSQVMCTLGLVGANINCVPYQPQMPLLLPL